MDTFEAYVNELKASGLTPLYDALNLGLSELQNVKKQFPGCTLRMLCLTDGHDQGSRSDPVEVAVKLINANIVVDSVLLGEQVNTVLHGISNTTEKTSTLPAGGSSSQRELLVMDFDLDGECVD
ncbi:hypothetical protein AAFF_G00222100 [Aldrovandia affinis]|uniref:VWFA domain-containing protein n=1 Tax=Aldrovandia affinis TaxID=143900 RepID=A0AAD7RG04_9TELE|nr:hypothetical protein AAFF_G00222100 [Aldrovandia affinis]